MKLEFEEIKKALLNYDAQSELKQASIIMLQNIFKNAAVKQLQLDNNTSQNNKSNYDELRQSCNRLLAALNNREIRIRDSNDTEKQIANLKVYH